MPNVLGITLQWLTLPLEDTVFVHAHRMMSSYHMAEILLRTCTILHPKHLHIYLTCIQGSHKKFVLYIAYIYDETCIVN